MIIKFFEENRKFSVFITLIGAILIFYISSLSFSNVNNIKGDYSVLYHFLAFFCFGFFVFITLVDGRKNYLLFLIGFLISFGYALTDEIHQHFVLGRFCDIWDIYTDSLGIVLAMMIYLVILALRED